MLAPATDKFNKLCNIISLKTFGPSKVINKYSVNLLFINEVKNENQKYIYPIQTEEELINKLLTPAMEWARENKAQDGAEVKIWYDSTLLDSEAIENTEQILQALSSKEGLNNIILSDIREIEFVNNNKVLFT